LCCVGGVGGVVVFDDDCFLVFCGPEILFLGSKAIGAQNWKGLCSPAQEKNDQLTQQTQTITPPHRKTKRRWWKETSDDGGDGDDLRVERGKGEHPLRDQRGNPNPPPQPSSIKGSKRKGREDLRDSFPLFHLGSVLGRFSLGVEVLCGVWFPLRG
jgi:hypothetical protein